MPLNPFRKPSTAGSNASDTASISSTSTSSSLAHLLRKTPTSKTSPEVESTPVHTTSKAAANAQETKTAKEKKELTPWEKQQQRRKDRGVNMEAVATMWSLR